MASRSGSEEAELWGGKEKESSLRLLPPRRRPPVLRSSLCWILSSWVRPLAEEAFLRDPLSRDGFSGFVKYLKTVFICPFGCFGHEHIFEVDG